MGIFLSIFPWFPHCNGKIHHIFPIFFQAMFPMFDQAHVFWVSKTAERLQVILRGSMVIINPSLDFSAGTKMARRSCFETSL